jgi:BioD-like phosphotransacetylase family protein
LKSIYITSVDSFSGKTAMSLVVGRKLIERGKKVGYMKPLSFQPWRIGDKITDEDAAFVKDILGLDTQPWDLSPIVVDADYLTEALQSSNQEEMLKSILDKADEVSAEKDVMIFEGTGSLREGYVFGLPAELVAENLGSKVLAIVRYKDRRHLLDDVLAAKSRLQDDMGGVIINRVPADAMEFITKNALPFLKKLGIMVFGVLPETRALGALTLQEIYEVLGAELLTESYNPEVTVEALMVGAMTSQAALSRFRKQAQKAVITGGDRSDIQLAALETSTSCLILTGNLHPSPLVIKQAEDLGVAIFLVSTPTLETVEKLESLIGKVRIGQHAKLEKFESLVAQHVDVDALLAEFGLAD